MNWVLIVVVVIALICVICGWRAGFIKTVFHLCSFALALVIAAIFGPITSNIVVEQETMMNQATERAYDALELEKLANVKVATEDQLNDLDLPQPIIDQLKEFNVTKNYEELDVDNAADYIARTVAMIIIRCICYLIVFVVAILLLFLIGNSLNLVSKIGMLNTANRALGAAVGLVEALVIVYIVFALMTALGNTAFGQSAMKQIADNDFLTFLYDKNLVNVCVLDISKKFN